MTGQLDRIEADVKDLKYLLTGNGTPSNGLVVRVDRLEQSEKSRAWWTRTAAGAAVSAGIAAAFAVFKG